MYTPIAVFTYNRPIHTERLLRSLKSDPLLKHSPLRIYCDGPKCVEHEEAVAETRRVISANAPPNAEIIERQENFGLARSIITGVTELCEEYGRVIILEDDLVISPHTLDYFNKALDRYANEDRVMHISAYMFPVGKPLPSSFFYREATCWGWATWDRAWKYFEPDAAKLVAEIDEQGVRREFNIDESMYFYQMLCKQKDGELDSWAIRWYASMFRRDGLALHPGYSLVQNLGFDGSGVHCSVDSRFVVELRADPIKQFPDEIEESELARQAMIEYRHNSYTLQHRIKGRLHRLLARFR